MQLNKLVGAIRAKVDWHAVEDVMVGDSQIARVRYWLNNDPERGGIGFVAEQWCFDDQMWLIIGDQYGTPDEAKAACEQHVTCLLLGMVELDEAARPQQTFTFGHGLIGVTAFSFDEAGKKVCAIGIERLSAPVIIGTVTNLKPKFEDQDVIIKFDNKAGFEAFFEYANWCANWWQESEVADAIEAKTEHLRELKGQLDESTCQIMQQRLWMVAPKKAKCIAKDKDGRWYFWTNIPRFEEGDDCWHGGEYPTPADWSAIGLPEPERKWTDSLMLRPEGM